MWYTEHVKAPLPGDINIDVIGNIYFVYVTCQCNLSDEQINGLRIGPITYLSRNGKNVTVGFDSIHEEYRDFSWAKTEAYRLLDALLNYHQLPSFVTGVK